jgi:hypothetical protein
VEKVGREWAKEAEEVKKVKEVKEAEEVKEMEEVRGRAVGRVEEEICGFGEDNMKEFSTKLARESRHLQ